jgi:LPS-assembly lipoprotein
MRRRLLLAAAPAAALLGGCGFALRQAPDFAFRSIAVPSNAAVANELRRNLIGAGTVQVVALAAAPAPDVVFDLLGETRQKVIVAVTSTGQVREFQLRLRVSFRLRTPGGNELIPSTEITQQRDVSFNESSVLAKEAEEVLLYRDMQTDIVQQILRRLAAVKSLA